MSLREKMLKPKLTAIDTSKFEDFAEPVYIKSLTFKEMKRILDLPPAEQMPPFIVAVLVDSQGVPVFTLDDIESLPFGLGALIRKEGERLNGLADPKELDSIEKN